MPTNSLFPVFGQWQSIHRGAALDMFVGRASPRVKQAFAVMMFAHAAQRRKGPSSRPYAAHPLMVYLLVKAVSNDEDLLCAALLHDVVEDMCKSFPGVKREDVLANIEAVFGKTVAYRVECLSNPENFGGTSKRDWQLRHFRIHPEIQLVKMADKIANAYDSLFDTPQGWSDNKLADGVLDAARFAARAAHVPPLYAAFISYLQAEATRKGWLP